MHTGRALCSSMADKAAWSAAGLGRGDEAGGRGTEGDRDDDHRSRQPVTLAWPGLRGWPHEAGLAERAAGICSTGQAGGRGPAEGSALAVPAPQGVRRRGRAPGGAARGRVGCT
jgi:hypothetical protein